MKATTRERHATREEPLAAWAQTLKTKSITDFVWFVFLCLFGPTKLLSSEILDRDPGHYEVLPEWDTEG